MKKIVLFAIVIFLFASVACADAVIYGRAAIVVELDLINDIVTVRDAVGFEWQWNGCEDYMIGDQVVMVLMATGRPNYILDDIIIDFSYSGYVAADLK